MSKSKHIRIKDFVIPLDDFRAAVPTGADSDRNTIELTIHFWMGDPIVIYDREDIKAFLDYFDQG